MEAAFESPIIDEGQSHFQRSLGFKKFDLWPNSDTWYSHSKQRYGTDIQNLCRQILERRKHQNSHSN